MGFIGLGHHLRTVLTKQNELPWGGIHSAEDLGP